MDSLHYAGDYDVANISGNFFFYLEIETTDEIFRLPLSNVVISLSHVQSTNSWTCIEWGTMTCCCKTVGAVKARNFSTSDGGSAAFSESLVSVFVRLCMLRGRGLSVNDVLLLTSLVTGSSSHDEGGNLPNKWEMVLNQSKLHILVGGKKVEGWRARTAYNGWCITTVPIALSGRGNELPSSRYIDVKLDKRVRGAIVRYKCLPTHHSGLLLGLTYHTNIWIRIRDPIITSFTFELLPTP